MCCIHLATRSNQQQPSFTATMTEAVAPTMGNGDVVDGDDGSNRSSSYHRFCAWFCPSFFFTKLLFFLSHFFSTLFLQAIFPLSRSLSLTFTFTFFFFPKFFLLSLSSSQMSLFSFIYLFSQSSSSLEFLCHFLLFFILHRFIFSHFSDNFLFFFFHTFYILYNFIFFFLSLLKWNFSSTSEFLHLR